MWSWKHATLIGGTALALCGCLPPVSVLSDTEPTTADGWTNVELSMFSRGTVYSRESLSSRLSEGVAQVRVGLASGEELRGTGATIEGNRLRVHRGKEHRTISLEQVVYLRIGEFESFRHRSETALFGGSMLALVPAGAMVLGGALQGDPDVILGGLIAFGSERLWNLVSEVYPGRYSSPLASYLWPEYYLEVQARDADQPLVLYVGPTLVAIKRGDRYLIKGEPEVGIAQLHLALDSLLH